MGNTRQDHESHKTPDHKNTSEKQSPYWKRAHHDVRFWFMVILMLVTMVFYVMSDNFALL